MKFSSGIFTVSIALVLVSLTACSSPKKAVAPTPTSSAAAARIAATASIVGTAGTTTAGSTPATVLRPASGAPVDGIPCETSEQLTYHVHSHLTILNNSQPVQVPALIGIVDNRCIYWLHTHDTSGIIHVEAPSKRDFTLGQFFDIWGQALDSTHVAGLTAGSAGSFQFYVDGKQYTGDPRQIPLGSHAQIVVEFGQSFTPPPAYTFPPGY